VGILPEAARRGTRAVRGRGGGGGGPPAAPPPHGGDLGVRSTLDVDEFLDGI
jgi:hypothetical protein